MGSSILTSDQTALLGRMLYLALVEIRMLSATKSTEQAFALADAFHNLPLYMFSPNFSREKTRMFLEGYQSKYPRVVKDGVVSGSYFDYLSMLDEIERQDIPASNS